MKPQLKIVRGVVARSNCDCDFCRVAFGKLPKNDAEAKAVRRKWDARRKPRRSA